MKIIAFYGFKGGVGRSIALYNVAYLLAAKRGARVVLADWDIHAPGLTCLPELEDPQNPGPSQGVVEVLVDLVQPTEDDSVLDPGPLVHPTRVGERVRAASGGDANIWLLPAGRFDGSIDRGEYGAALNRINPRLSELVKVGQKDVVAWFAERILESFRARGERDPDYLFLDTRTGLTEVGELLLSPATDQVVIVFGLNRQNLSGMEHVLRRLSRPSEFGAANLPNRVVLVASPVPSGEEELKERKLREVQEIALRVVEEAAREQSPPGPVPIEPVVPTLLSLPYHPFLALSDELMVEKFPASEPSRAYEQLAETLRIRESNEIDGGKPHDLVGESSLANEGRVRLEGVEYPLARRLPWNVVRPDAKPSTPVGISLSATGTEQFLTRLANSLKISDEERAQILISYTSFTVAQWQQLGTRLINEPKEWLMYSSAHWPSIAEKAGKSWTNWAFLSAIPLDVTPEQAAERLFLGWPYPFSGETGVRAAIGAVDTLAGRLKGVHSITRKWLDGICKANPTLPLAHGIAGDRILRYVKDRSTARAYFSKAQDLPADEASFSLGDELLNSAHELMKDRQEDARLLLEEAATHYQKVSELRHHYWYWAAKNNMSVVLSDLASLFISTSPLQALSLAEQAAQHAENARTEKPDMARIENNLGRAHYIQAKILATTDAARAHGLLAQARRHLERSLNLDPSEARTEVSMGHMLGVQAQLLKLTEPARAVQLFSEASSHSERAFVLDPILIGAAEDCTTSELHRAQLLQRLDRQDEARTALQKALHFAQRVQQITGKASYNLACALAQTGNGDEALQTLESLLREKQLPTAKQVESDPDFASLASEPRFQVILATLRDQQPA